MKLFVNPRLALLCDLASAATARGVGHGTAWDIAEKTIQQMPMEYAIMLAEDEDTFKRVRASVLANIEAEVQL